MEEIFPDRGRATGRGSPAARRWLEDFTLAELKRLDAGSWFDPKFRGTRIPAFVETIDALRGRSGLFIELKSPERYEGIEKLVLDELKAKGLDQPGADPRTPVLLQSFTASSLGPRRGLASEWGCSGPPRRQEARPPSSSLRRRAPSRRRPWAASRFRQRRDACRRWVQLHGIGVTLLFFSCGSRPLPPNPIREVRVWRALEPPLLPRRSDIRSGMRNRLQLGCSVSM